MIYNKIKSYAKINLALNITGKNTSFHKIESIIAFVDLHDIITINKIKSKKHNILFTGKFSQNIRGSSISIKLGCVLTELKPFILL